MSGSRVKTLIKFVVSISLIVFLSTKIDFSTFRVLGWKYLIPIAISVCIGLTAIFLMSVRWLGFCTTFLDIKPKIITLYTFYLIGSFFNIFLPGAIGGDIVRTQKLVSRFKVKIKSATFITIAERILGLYGLCVLLLISLILKTYPPKLKIIPELPTFWFYVGILVLFLLLPLTRFLLKKRQLEVSYTFIFETILILLMAQFGDIIIAYLLSHYMGVSISFFAIMFIMPIVYFATVIPVSLGGLGVREGTFAGLMLLYGVSTSTSVIISFSMYFVKILIGIIGGIIYIKEK